jgi:hypothetical protein
MDNDKPDDKEWEVTDRWQVELWENVVFTRIAARGQISTPDDAILFADAVLVEWRKRFVMSEKREG